MLKPLYMSRVDKNFDKFLVDFSKVGQESEKGL